MAYVAVILENEGKVLLHFKDNKEWILYPSHWSAFGDKIEKGKEPLQAAVREIEEELGVKLDEKKIGFLGKVTVNDKDVYVKILGENHAFQGVVVS